MLTLRCVVVVPRERREAGEGRHPFSCPALEQERTARVECWCAPAEHCVTWGQSNAAACQSHVPKLSRWMSFSLRRREGRGVEWGDGLVQSQVRRFVFPCTSICPPGTSCSHLSFVSTRILVFFSRSLFLKWDFTVWSCASKVCSNISTKKE